jgi:class 3 adenylate cyclase
VQKIFFPPELDRAVLRCRYALYLAIGVLVVLQTWRQGSVSSFWLLICLMQAAAAQWLLKRAIHRSIMQAIYLVEWLLVVAFVCWVGLSALAAVAALLVVLVCYTTLWGWRWCLLYVASGGLCGLGFWYFDTISFPRDIWVDSLALGAAGLFMLVICSIAHHQVRQQLRYGLALKNRNSLLLRYLPTDLPSYLGDNRAMPFQRQWASVMFIDVVDFTRAVQQLPVEDLSILLNEFFDGVHQTVEQWGGSVTKFLGDGALCIFPSSTDQQRHNMARQALRCAQVMPQQFLQATLQREGLPAGRLSLGIASGYCCIGQWGGARRDFTVIGAPVNLASRLQQRAKGHGGLLLDRSTAHLAACETYTRQPISLPLRGFGEVPAYALPIFAFDK